MDILINTSTVIHEPTPSITLLVGQALVKEKRRDWMDMNDLADFCKSQKVQLDDKYATAQELETALRAAMNVDGEFYADGVAIDAYDRRVGWDLVFMIRAYPYSQSTSGFNTTELEPLTACED